MTNYKERLEALLEGLEVQYIKDFMEGSVEAHREMGERIAARCKMLNPNFGEGEDNE